MPKFGIIRSARHKNNSNARGRYFSGGKRSVNGWDVTVRMMASAGTDAIAALSPDCRPSAADNAGSGIARRSPIRIQVLVPGGSRPKQLARCAGMFSGGRWNHV
jgi:hypothetical protein